MSRNLPDDGSNTRAVGRFLDVARCWLIVTKSYGVWSIAQYCILHLFSLPWETGEAKWVTFWGDGFRY